MSGSASRGDGGYEDISPEKENTRSPPNLQHDSNENSEAGRKTGAMETLSPPTSPERHSSSPSTPAANDHQHQGQPGVRSFLKRKSEGIVHDERLAVEEESYAMFHHLLTGNQLQTAYWHLFAQHFMDQWMLYSQIMSYSVNGFPRSSLPDFASSYSSGVNRIEPHFGNVTLQSPLLSRSGYNEYSLYGTNSSGSNADTGYGALQVLRERQPLNKAPIHNDFSPSENNGNSLNSPLNSGYYYIPTAFPGLLCHLRADVASLLHPQGAVQLISSLAAGLNTISSSSSRSITHDIEERNSLHPHHKCMICLKEYRRKSSLRSHMFRKHKVRSPVFY